jgi:8-oxo-dGTP diphosphatase
MNGPSSVFRPSTPFLTVDIIIELQDQVDHPIVLIERRNPPSGWALPGGFVDTGETLEQAAVREAREETCLDVELRCLLGCYSDPARDQRMHTVSAVYIAHARGEPHAADDARHLAVFAPEQIDVQLAFDHQAIINDYLHYKKTGALPAPRT